MAIYRAFSATPPSAASAGDATPINVGMEFYVTSAATLTKIHWLQPTTGATSSATRTLSLWNTTTGVQVGSSWTSTAVGAAGQWVDTTLPSPVTLTPGQYYSVMVLHPGGQYAATASYFPAGAGVPAISNGPLRIPSTTDAVKGQGCFVEASTPAMGTQGFNGGNYWVDITVEDTNVAPTVDAGADQTIPVNTAVSLAGSATDSDGSIASVAWSFVSLPEGVTAPALTGGTTNNASFTPTAPGKYTMQFAATDNGGSTGTDTVIVYATSSTGKPGSVVSLGSWTATGGTGSAVLADGSDTTYDTSPDSPATPQAMEVGLTPVGPKTTGTLSVRLLQTAAGAGTATVALKENGTVRKTWSGVATTTSAATLALTLTGAECATITDWNNLTVEVTWGP